MKAKSKSVAAPNKTRKSVAKLEVSPGGMSAERIANAHRILGRLRSKGGAGAAY